MEMYSTVYFLSAKKAILHTCSETTAGVYACPETG